MFRVSTSNCPTNFPYFNCISLLWAWHELSVKKQRADWWWNGKPLLPTPQLDCFVHLRKYAGMSCSLLEEKHRKTVKKTHQVFHLLGCIMLYHVVSGIIDRAIQGLHNLHLVADQTLHRLIVLLQSNESWERNANPFAVRSELLPPASVPKFWAKKTVPAGCL